MSPPGAKWTAAPKTPAGLKIRSTKAIPRVTGEAIASVPRPRKEKPAAAKAERGSL
jgi:hypothetical protein